MAVINTVILAQATQPLGPLTTSIFTLPSAIPPMALIEILGAMNLTDIQDPTLIIPIILQIQSLADSTWQDVVSCTWTGNMNTNKAGGGPGLPPYLAYRASNILGIQIQVVATLPKSLSIGFTGRTTI